MSTIPNSTIEMATQIHIGEINQYQGQSIRPTNFSTQKIIVTTQGAVNPLLLYFRSVSYIVVILVVIVHKIIKCITELVFKFFKNIS